MVFSPLPPKPRVSLPLSFQSTLSPFGPLVGCPPSALQVSARLCCLPPYPRRPSPSALCLTFFFRARRFKLVGAGCRAVGGGGRACVGTSVCLGCFVSSGFPFPNPFGYPRLPLTAPSSACLPPSPRSTLAQASSLPRATLRVCAKGCLVCAVVW